MAMATAWLQLVGSIDWLTTDITYGWLLSHQVRGLVKLNQPLTTYDNTNFNLNRFNYFFPQRFQSYPRA